MADATFWRSSELGERRQVDLPQGRMRVFERGSGPPIVFVHGALVNANLWRKVVPRLAGQLRCVALDLPLGSHELPMPGVDYTDEGLADLIADAIDELGLDDVILVGNDTGGGLCQLVVTRRPERIGRLVLTSSDAYEGTRTLRAVMAALRAPARVPASAPILFAPLRLRPARRPLFAAVMKSRLEPHVSDSYALPALEQPEVRADALSLLRAGIDFDRLTEASRRFREFGRPVLVAWSADDIVFPREHAERLARDFPDARLEWIDDARTFSPEDQPERLAELIGNFARETATTSEGGTAATKAAG